jgi:purine-nucleoside phosphorylase
MANNGAPYRASTVYDWVHKAADHVTARLQVAPRVAIVLGTGLGGIADAIDGALVLPYGEIPHFPRSTVLGHAGRLVLGTLHGVPVAAMQGRFHLYEGYTPGEIVFPLRVLQALGAEIAMLTNAAGGLNPAFTSGTLMLVTDSIGLPMLAGLNPLVGPNDDRIGPRFPPLAGAFDTDLRARAREVATAQRIELAEGVYVMVAGPNYESPAELRFLRAIGADAVGMSTVPEVIAARHMGMRVLAISCITNLALPSPDAAAVPDSSLHAPEVPSHEEVLAVAEAAGTRLAAVLEGTVARLSQRQ